MQIKNKQKCVARNVFLNSQYIYRACPLTGIKFIYKR